MSPLARITSRNRVGIDSARRWHISGRCRKLSHTRRHVLEAHRRSAPPIFPFKDRVAPQIFYDVKVSSFPRPVDFDDVGVFFELLFYNSCFMNGSMVLHEVYGLVRRDQSVCVWQKIVFQKADVAHRIETSRSWHYRPYTSRRHGTPEVDSIMPGRSVSHKVICLEPGYKEMQINYD